MAKKEEIPEDVLEGEEVAAVPIVPPEEELPPEGEVPAAGTTITHTVDEIPELSGKGVGDILTWRIAAVSEDGNSFDFEIMPVEEEVLPPAVAPAPVPGGRGAITEAMIT